MNEQILFELANQSISMGSYPDPRFPPSIYYRFLGLLALEIKPRLAVELGVCGGGGSLAMADYYPGGRVIGVDIEYLSYLDNLKFILATYPNFVFWCGDSVEAADSIGQVYGPVDLLFIDTLHTYEQTMAEWEAWSPYLAPNAIVCLDDLLKPEMGEVWEAIPVRNKLRLDFLHTGAEASEGGGFGVVWGF